MPNFRRSCGTCFFWSHADAAVPPSGAATTCRLTPPDPEHGWPETRQNDWCGQWRGNDDPPPREFNTLKATIRQTIPGKVVDGLVTFAVGSGGGTSSGIVSETGDLLRQGPDGGWKWIGSLDGWDTQLSTNPQPLMARMMD